MIPMYCSVDHAGGMNETYSSASRIGCTAPTAWMLRTRPWWFSIAAFGLPVVPDV